MCDGLYISYIDPANHDVNQWIVAFVFLSECPSNCNQCSYSSATKTTTCTSCATGYVARTSDGNCYGEWLKFIYLIPNRTNLASYAVQEQ